MADLGIIKIEEDESGSEKKDNPEDLSLKTRSISIQTDDCIQGIMSSYFPHLSQDQIQAFLSLLATILHQNQTERKQGEEGFNDILERNQIFRKPGWISLEPDFAMPQIKDDLNKITEANDDQNKEMQTLDIKPQLPFLTSEDWNPIITKPTSQLSNVKSRTENLDGNSRQNAEPLFKLENQVDSDWITPISQPKIAKQFGDDETIKVPAPNLRTVTAFVPYRIKKVSSTPTTVNKPPQSRDERIEKSLQIPFSVDFVINSSTEEFNEINLNEEQRNACRDIRRRGKNKIAAQNCRKRKYEQINSLEEELEHFQRRKESMRKENEELVEIHKSWKDSLENMENQVFKAGVHNLSDILGRDK